MKTIILGCGYLGYHFAKALIDKGESVQVIGLPSFYSEKIKDRFLALDLFGEENLSKIDFGHSVIIDCLNLFAPNIKETDEVHLELELTQKYELLFEYLLYQNIHQYIYLSSGGTVYGECEFPAKESDTPKPTTFYGHMKYVLEEQLIASGLPYTILRLANPYGGESEPGRTQGLIGVIKAKLQSNSPLELYGDPASTRDYIYIDDVSEIITRVAGNHKTLSQIINIATGTSTSLEEIIAISEKIAGKKLTVHNPGYVIEEVLHNQLNNTKLKELLDFHQFIPVEEGIKTLYNRQGENTL